MCKDSLYLIGTPIDSENLDLRYDNARSGVFRSCLDIKFG